MQRILLNRNVYCSRDRVGPKITAVLVDMLREVLSG